MNLPALTGGIMDQYASLFGKNAALFLDCRSLIHQTIPISLDSKPVVAGRHTGENTVWPPRVITTVVLLVRKALVVIKRNIPGSDFAVLRDVTRTMLYECQDKLGDDTFIKNMFVVEEIDRARAAERLQRKDMQGFGDLMFEAHWGLSQPMT